jgi:small subunit ribosomal protein S5
MAFNPEHQSTSEYAEKIVQVSRVSKKTKGGNQIGFSVLVVVGDRKGKVGVAFGKGPDVLSSIKKGIRKAKKNLIDVPVQGTTIPFRILRKHGAAQVLLKPAPKGSGIIAGGAVRAVVEAAGIRDIVGKSLGSENQANNVYATFKALTEIRRLVTLKGIKLKPTDFEDLPPVKQLPKPQGRYNEHRRRTPAAPTTNQPATGAK